MPTPYIGMRVLYYPQRIHANNQKGPNSTKYNTGGRLQVAENITFECPPPLYIGEELVYDILPTFNI